jgi:hypothetical protein
MSSQPGTTYGTQFRFEATDVEVFSGSGSPEGVQVGDVGDWYVRSDPGTTAPGLYVKRSGTATTTGWVAVAEVGSTRTVEAVTTTKAPTSSESGECYTNEGDADGATITLPTAAAGLTFTVYVQTAQTVTVTAGTGDTIRLADSVTAAAGSITSAVVGSVVTLVAINATEWVAVAIVGSWSV